MAAKKPPAKGASGAGLTKKLGPLPVWGWIAAVIVGYLVYKKYSANKATTAATTGTATTPTETVTTSGGTYTGPVGSVPQAISNPNGASGGAGSAPVTTTQQSTPLSPALTSTPGTPATSPSTPGSTGGIPNSSTGPVIGADVGAAQSYLAATQPTYATDVTSLGGLNDPSNPTNQAAANTIWNAQTVANNTVLASNSQNALGLGGTPYASLTPAQQSQVQMYAAV